MNWPLTSSSETPLRGTRALVLLQDPVEANRLQARLTALGIEAWEANCASGAAAVLRRDELRGRPVDFLFVDGHFGGICGMSLCAALCMALRQRPEVLLTAPLDAALDSSALSRSGISTVIEADCSSRELEVLLGSYRRTAHLNRPERLTPAGRVTF
ncbi:MAG: hypothetical protein ACPG31_02410 [Planctomycetota bacterium]